MLVAFGAADVMISQVVPPSRLISRLIDSCVPRLWVHVRLCTLPTAQFTFVLGAVTVTAGTASVKGTALTPKADGSLDTIVSQWLHP